MRWKISRFLREVIDITGPHVCAYKVQKAFFDVFSESDTTFSRRSSPTCRTIIRKSWCSSTPRSAISTTQWKLYLRNIFEEIRADGLVVNPYMGDDVLKPFGVTRRQSGRRAGEDQ